MYRFQTSPQRTPGKKLWVSLLLFLFLILLFTLGTSSLSENTVRRQKESLTQALRIHMYMLSQTLPLKYFPHRNEYIHELLLQS